jgi:hypothetical protein
LDHANRDDVEEGNDESKDKPLAKMKALEYNPEEKKS